MNMSLDVPPNLVAAAYDLFNHSEYQHLIEPVKLCGIQPQFLMVRGDVIPHTDKEFPKWGYVWVIRSDDANARLKRHGHVDLVISVGMVIELNVWRRHSFKQKQIAHFVWLPLDSDVPLPAADVLACYASMLEA